MDSTLALVTKRKLTRAVKLAIADRKIPSEPYTLYRDTITNEVGLIWRNMCYSAAIRARSDGTIYICHADTYAPDGYYARGLVEWSPVV